MFGKLFKKKSKNKIKKSEKKSKINFTFTFGETFLLVAVISIILSISSALIVFVNYPSISKKITIGVSTDGKISDVEEAYNYIVNKYIGVVDEEELASRAIEGMFNYVTDKNSDYLTQTETESLDNKLGGSYQGIGVEVTTCEQGMKILTVFDDSPAFSAGLLVDDIITKVDGNVIIENSVNFISEYTKANTGKQITIEYLRGEETMTTQLSTGTISLPSVTTKQFEDTGYLKISTFASNTYSQAKKALTKLENSNISSLIVDLRDNTGGYLDIAYEISDLFAPKGNVIYQLKYKDGKTSKVKAKQTDERSYDIVVLINGSSASASEILGMSLKENNKAYIIGTTSYGKGTVQETEHLSDGTMYKISTAYWLSPSGKCIDKVGIIPDKSVAYNEEEDIQLNEAILYLNSKNDQK